MKDAAFALAVVLAAALGATPPAAAQEEDPAPPETLAVAKAPEAAKAAEAPPPPAAGEVDEAEEAEEAPQAEEEEAEPEGPPIHEITEAEYRAAIRRPGFNPDCLHLTDVGRGILAVLSADEHGRSDVGTGFALEICTPANWIARKMAEAERQYRPLAWKDLDEEDRSDVLHVVALPDRTTNRRHVDMGDSVAHMVLRHPDEKLRNHVIVQPLFTRPFDVEQRNRRGDSATFEGLEAAFPIDALKTVRDAKGEFLITVVGRSEEKNFKVKQKHLDDLGLE
jgi:hypothetical protein